MFRPIALVTAVAATATCLLTTAAPGQERDLKFVLDFISLGRHAPWYVALGKGYFKDEGLNVTIMPSKGTADAIRTVATGGAELGFIDIPSLVASGSAGASVKIVAANYQKPPYCIFTLNPGANVTEPKQMADLELGSSTASFVPKIWAAFMEMNKVDSKTLKIVNIDAAARVPMLAAGKVQSIDQFLMSEPAIRRAVTNAKPVCLFAGDYGLEIYANSLGVSEDFLTKNPDVVKKFTRAALKGWKDALADPEEAARIEIQYVKALDPAIVVEEIAILKRIAVTPDVEKNGFGYVSVDRMKNTVDFINKNIEVSGDKLTAEQIYRPGYLPEISDQTVVRAMDTRELSDKGLKLRQDMFGKDAVEQRMNAFGAFGEPLQNIINAYAYGDVWSRPALPMATKSLAMIAMMAAVGRPNELRVHVKGALTNGCTAEQIRGDPSAGRDVWRNSAGERGSSRRRRRVAGKRSNVVSGLPTYCCAIPAASRTAFQRASSLARCLPNASGEEPCTTTPALVNRSRTTSSARLSLITLLSLAMIAGGTSRGAKMPYQVVTS